MALGTWNASLCALQLPRASDVEVASRGRSAYGAKLRRLAAGWSASALLLMAPQAGLGFSDAIEIAEQITPPAAGSEDKISSERSPMEEFLDRLMVAESGGRADAKNPRSSALGPFQFIEATFLLVTNKYFAAEIASLNQEQILALRKDMAFSRRAARAYVNDLIAALQDQGLATTMGNLRLAFLVGPLGAVRVLRAQPDQPVKDLLSADAIAANPFMSGATAGSLIQRAALDISGSASARRLAILKGEAGVAKPKPPFEINCLITLAPCRKWVAMQQRKLDLRTRNAQR
jgi:hypothetical protein